MEKHFIFGLFSEQLSKFIVGFNKDQINANLLTGKGSISNVHINVSTINEILQAQIPFLSLKSAYVSELSFNVTSFANIRKAPIEIFIDEIHILLEEQLEYRSKDNSSTSSNNISDSKAVKCKPTSYGLVQRIIDNLTIEIERVYLTFQPWGTFKTRVFGPWTPPAISIVFDRLKYVSVDEYGQPGSPDEVWQHNDRAYRKNLQERSAMNMNTQLQSSFMRKGSIMIYKKLSFQTSMAFTNRIEGMGPKQSYFQGLSLFSNVSTQVHFALLKAQQNCALLQAQIDLSILEINIEICHRIWPMILHSVTGLFSFISRDQSFVDPLKSNLTKFSSPSKEGRTDQVPTVTLLEKSLSHNVDEINDIEDNNNEEEEEEHTSDIQDEYENESIGTSIGSFEASINHDAIVDLPDFGITIFEKLCISITIHQSSVIFRCNINTKDTTLCFVVDGLVAEFMIPNITAKGSLVQFSIHHLQVKENHNKQIHDKTIFSVGEPIQYQCEEDKIRDKSGAMNFPTFEARPINRNFDDKNQDVSFALGIKSVFENINDTLNKGFLSIVNEAGFDCIFILLDIESWYNVVVIYSLLKSRYDIRWYSGDWSDLINDDMLSSSRPGISLKESIQVLQFFNRNPIISSLSYSVTAKFKSCCVEIKTDANMPLDSADIILSVEECMIIKSEALPRSLIPETVSNINMKKKDESTFQIYFPDDAGDFLDYPRHDSEIKARYQITLEGVKIEVKPCLRFVDKKICKIAELARIVIIGSIEKSHVDDSIFLFTSILCDEWIICLEIDAAISSMTTLYHIYKYREKFSATSIYQYKNLLSNMIFVTRFSIPRVVADIFTHDVAINMKLLNKYSSSADIQLMRIFHSEIDSTELCIKVKNKKAILKVCTKTLRASIGDVNCFLESNSGPPSDTNDSFIGVNSNSDFIYLGTKSEDNPCINCPVSTRIDLNEECVITLHLSNGEVYMDRIIQSFDPIVDSFRYHIAMTNRLHLVQTDETMVNEPTETSNKNCNASYSFMQIAQRLNFDVKLHNIRIDDLMISSHNFQWKQSLSFYDPNQDPSLLMANEALKNTCTMLNSLARKIIKTIHTTQAFDSRADKGLIGYDSSWHKNVEMKLDDIEIGLKDFEKRTRKTHTDKNRHLNVAYTKLLEKDRQRVSLMSFLSNKVCGFLRCRVDESTTRAGSSTSFWRRWCILSRNYLVIMTNPTDMKLIDIICLDGAKLFGISRAGGASYMKKGFCLFDIHSIKRYFLVENREDYDLWVSGLTETLASDAVDFNTRMSQDDEWIDDRKYDASKTEEIVDVCGNLENIETDNQNELKEHHSNLHCTSIDDVHHTNRNNDDDVDVDEVMVNKGHTSTSEQSEELLVPDANNLSNYHQKRGNLSNDQGEDMSLYMNIEDIDSTGKRPSKLRDKFSRFKLDKTALQHLNRRTQNTGVNIAINSKLPTSNRFKKSLTDVIDEASVKSQEVEKESQDYEDDNSFPKNNDKRSKLRDKMSKFGSVVANSVKLDSKALHQLNNNSNIRNRDLLKSTSSHNNTSKKQFKVKGLQVDINNMILRKDSLTDIKNSGFEKFPGLWKVAVKANHVSTHEVHDNQNDMPTIELSSSAIDLEYDCDSIRFDIRLDCILWHEAEISSNVDIQKSVHDFLAFHSILSDIFLDPIYEDIHRHTMQSFGQVLERLLHQPITIHLLRYCALILEKFLDSFLSDEIPIAACKVIMEFLNIDDKMTTRASVSLQDDVRSHYFDKKCEVEIDNHVFHSLQNLRYEFRNVMSILEEKTTSRSDVSKTKCNISPSHRMHFDFLKMIQVVKKERDDAKAQLIAERTTHNHGIKFYKDKVKYLESVVDALNTSTKSTNSSSELSSKSFDSEYIKSNDVQLLALCHELSNEISKRIALECEVTRNEENYALMLKAEEVEKELLRKELDECKLLLVSDHNTILQETLYGDVSP